MFESKPIDFEKEDPRSKDKRDPSQQWKMFYNLILLKSGGINDIRGAVEKVYEVNDYDKLVIEAFAKGIKPPKKLSVTE
jgi:hypothetical protein